VQPTAHPLFRIVAGGVRDWERVKERESARGRGTVASIEDPSAARSRR
jgi:hypothetical protein